MRSSLPNMRSSHTVSCSSNVYFAVQSCFFLFNIRSLAGKSAEEKLIRENQALHEQLRAAWWNQQTLEQVVVSLSCVVCHTYVSTESSVVSYSSHDTSFQLPHTGSCMNASGYKTADTQRSVASGDANGHDPRENKERRWRRARRAKRSSTSPSAASRNRQKHRRRRNNDKGWHNELERCFSWASGSSS